MPGYLLTMSCSVSCAHGGTAKPGKSNSRVKIAGTPLVALDSQFTISGCTYTDPAKQGAPAPCTAATFLPATGTTRVKSGGQALLCMSSTTGPCISTATTPVPLLPVSDAGQSKVKGM